MTKLDFSKDLYNEFKLKYPDSCAAGEEVRIKFAIENYKPNKNGDGFALSYVFSAEFKNSEIADSDKAPIHLLISKKPADEDVKIGETQTHSVKVFNISGKPQGMTVAVLSTTSCVDIDME